MEIPSVLLALRSIFDLLLVVHSSSCVVVRQFAFLGRSLVCNTRRTSFIVVGASQLNL